MEDATNPETGVEPEAATASGEDQAQTEAPETEVETPEGEDQSEAEDDSEELDLNGQKYRVPKALKGAFMMHADYTRKTQEVADKAKALEAREIELAQQAEAKAAFVEDHASVLALRSQVEAYKSVDWQTAFAQDPGSAQAAWVQYSSLKDALSDAERGLEGKMQQRALTEQREAAKRIQEGYARLPEVIPGWGPDLEVKVAKFALSEGVSQEQLREAVADPVNIKLLHLAMVGAESLKTQQKAQQVSKAAAVTPAKTVSGKASPPPTGLDDRLSADEWVRRRNEQLRKRG